MCFDSLSCSLTLKNTLENTWVVGRCAPLRLFMETRNIISLQYHKLYFKCQPYPFHVLISSHQPCVQNKSTYLSWIKCHNCSKLLVMHVGLYSHAVEYSITWQRLANSDAACSKEWLIKAAPAVLRRSHEWGVITSKDSATRIAAVACFVEVTFCTVTSSMNRV